MALDVPEVLEILLRLVTGGVYAYVGHQLGRRRVDADAALAAKSFSTWWYALAVTQVVGAGMRAATALGVRDLALHVTSTYITFLLLCIALAALLYYLVYLLTGKRGAIYPIAGGYVLYYVSIVYAIVWGRPVGLAETENGVTIQYANVFPPLVTAVILSLLLLPAIGAAVGYSTLFFRVKGATPRYRIGLVSLTIVLWFGSTGIASIVGASGEDWWRVVSTLIGLVAALAILAAYKPPAWVRRRWGVETLADEPSRT